MKVKTKYVLFYLAGLVEWGVLNLLPAHFSRTVEPPMGGFPDHRRTVRRSLRGNVCHEENRRLYGPTEIQGLHHCRFVHVSRRMPLVGSRTLER